MFHGILEENEELKGMNESQEEQLSNKRDECVVLNKRVDTLEKECETWAGEEQDLLERERRATVLECKVESEMLRVQDHKDMFSQVFRNLETRRTVFPVQPAAHISDSGMTGPGGFVEERTQTEKTE